MSDGSTAHYTVLARRFRPQRFEDVVGQQHVAMALRNAIASGRVAHAYLFSGARGVGKTSMARILAKALNCPNAIDGNPCGECDICKGVAAGNDIDVMEIDGASNRRIEDIRDLRSNVNEKSMRTRFKMYIIDEVHMLTKEAFNALLKTLEEPPANVKFVFCTTEPNKVPDTILSRCQRFDFWSIETANIAERLSFIAQSEGVKVEPDAVDLVARRAGGSMRDSQSIFDQLLAFGSDHITADDVHRMLGTAGDDLLHGMVESVQTHQTGDALNRLEDAIHQGVQLEELAEQLIHYTRDLLVIAGGARNLPLMSVAATWRDELTVQAEAWGLNRSLAALELLAEAKSRMRRSHTPRVLLELALVRLSLLDDLNDLSAAISQLGGPGGGPAALPGSPQGRSPQGRPASGSSGPGRPAAGGPGRPVGGRPTNSLQTSPANDIPAEGGRSVTVGNSEGNEANSIAGSISAVLLKEPSEGAAEVSVRPTACELIPGSESVFWAQLVATQDSTIRAWGGGYLRAAISGPNTLEMTFPASYTLFKNHCDKSGGLRRMEEVAAEMAGRPISIVLNLAPADQVDTKAATPEVERKILSRSKDVTDPFVLHAQTIFSASVTRAEELPVESAREFEEG